MNETAMFAGVFVIENRSATIIITINPETLV